MTSERPRGILISALRRSGTTVLWETFRLDPGLICYDEPFHPGLWRGERENEKGTWRELAEAWRALGDPPVAGARPILPRDELAPELSPEQILYLRTLFSREKPVVADCVRTWSKLEALSRGLDSVLLVHLVRHPASWVNAQLLPTSTGLGWRRKLSDVYRQWSFFRRRGFYDNWHYEEIIAHSLRADPGLWRSIGRSAEEVERQPAYKKLLGFWWAATLRSERQLRAAYGDRYLTLSADEFFSAPQRIFEEMYRRCDWSLPAEVRFDHVRLSRPAWQEDSRRWVEGLESAGIPKELWDRASFSGEAVRECARRFVA